MTKLILTDNITPCEVVMYYFQEYSEEECEDLLMSSTIYPFGSIEWIAEEIYEAYLKSKEI